MPEPVGLPKLTRPTEVRAWLAAQDFLPSRVLGQNFLIDENILRIMIDDAELQPSDRVLEVGPGLGIVTAQLIERAGAVVAIEKDKRLAAHLATHFGSEPKLTLLAADALAQNWHELISAHRLNKAVANLPYSVGSRLLVEWFMLGRGLDSIVVTVQLEVAERLCARAGADAYGLLSIWAQLDYEARIVKKISPACFHPRPTVTSAIVRLRRVQERRAALARPARFDSLIKTAFSKRRKQIGTILQGVSEDGPAALAAAGIDPKRRPETIEVEAWITLTNALQPER